MKRLLTLLLMSLCVSLSSCSQQSMTSEEQTLLEFLNHRFGMFIHYNMGTFHAEQWAKPNHDPKSFNPTKLNCDQWARGAKSAGMTYGVFTTKHHDGFCLWDTEVTDYDVASSSFDGDVVREYVDAFRKHGLTVGLYFSVWDRQHGVEKGSVTPEGIEFTKRQLTELLSNYGPINCLVIDGWGSVWGRSPTFEEIPFEVLADHIHSLQPNCLIINHSCRSERAYTQVVHYEATHGQHCPNDNTIPSQQGPTIQPAWFWESGFENQELKPLDEILDELNFCNSRTANYLLNAAPNADGMMDENVMSRLAEVGKAWRKPAPMKSLPQALDPHSTVVSTASSTAEGFSTAMALDANLFTSWRPAKDDPSPEIILDFGCDQTFNKVVCGERHGAFNSLEYEISALVDGQWRVIASGESMRFHSEHRFDDVTAQKFKLSIPKKKGWISIAEITFIKY